MPNVGKPSKGCKHCRDRKVKCDLKRPSCSQCIRVGMKCHGYRDPLSMMFKNESNIVVSKAQKRYKDLSKKDTGKPSVPKKFPVMEQASKTLPIESSAQTPKTVSTVSRPIHPDRPMTPSIEQQALGFFAANNLMQPSIALRGQYQWLFQILSGPDVDASLQSSAHALSVATLATATKSQSLIKKAQEHYAHALTTTNNALGDPIKVYEDSTLASVILLGVYENFMFDNHSMHAWMQHLKGASTLFELRGEEQFKSDFAMQIFMQFYRTTVDAGIELGTPIPCNVARLYKFITSMDNYSIYGLEHQVKVLKEAITIMQNETGDPVAIVSDALKLDHELENLDFFLQTLWRYETMYLEEPAEHIFGNAYHIYLNPWVASIWNTLRICRIRLFKFVLAQVKRGLQCFPPLFSNEEADAHISSCTKVIRSQILAMCASTVQLTGQIAFPHQVKNSSDPRRGGIGTVNLQEKMYKIHPQGTFLEPFKATGLAHLVGPLYEIGRSDYSAKLTQWAIDQLYFIARKIGTRQAITLAEGLKGKLKDESNFQVWNDPCPRAAQLAALAV